MKLICFTCNLPAFYFLRRQKKIFLIFKKNEGRRVNFLRGLFSAHDIKDLNSFIFSVVSEGMKETGV